MILHSQVETKKHNLLRNNVWVRENFSLREDSFRKRGREKSCDFHRPVTLSAGTFVKSWFSHESSEKEVVCISKTLLGSEIDPETIIKSGD